MRKVSIRLLLLALLAGLLTSAPALAQRHGHGHGHVRFGIGIHFGVPLFGYPYYYPPAYHYPSVYSPVYYPPVVLSQPAPPVYVEQSAPQPAAQRASQPTESWWYFCAESNGYYPYVRQCPAGWQRVSPRPPG